MGESDKEQRDIVLDILENNRNDELFEQIIDEFCSKFNGQITKEEVKEILNKNGFQGFYVLNDRDYEYLDFLDFECTGSVGNYMSDLKCIAIKESQLPNVMFIGCHELTHALLDSRLSSEIDTQFGTVSYGIGFEEGITTYVERLKGKSNSEMDESLVYGYPFNYQIICQLDLLYQRSKYKKYDSVVVEALKNPEGFFNLYYRMVLEACDKLFGSKSEKQKQLFALKCSFMCLHTADMLIEFLKKSVSSEDLDRSKTASFLVRRMNLSLLCVMNDVITVDAIPEDFKGHFRQEDYDYCACTKEEYLLGLMFESDEFYYKRVKEILENIMMNYLNLIDGVEKEVEYSDVYKI